MMSDSKLGYHTMLGSYSYPCTLDTQASVYIYVHSCTYVQGWPARLTVQRITGLAVITNTVAYYRHVSIIGTPRTSYRRIVYGVF